MKTKRQIFISGGIGKHPVTVAIWRNDDQKVRVYVPTKESSFRLDMLMFGKGHICITENTVTVYASF